jgi:carboxymethylenebutenolidase
MCFPPDALPPLPPGAGPPRPGQPLTLTARDGTGLLAWQATAEQPTGPGVVILPDVRGLFDFYRRLAEGFAAAGIDAVAIDYFGRTAGTGEREPDFDFMSHVRQTTEDTVAADVAAGVARLRADGRARALFTVGFCFGGSYSFLQAADPEPGLAGVIGFYGGMRQRREGGPTPISEAPRARVPVLGLFGGADQSIPPEQVGQFEAGLAAAGVEHTVHVYPGAPHSFFDRSFADHTAECADAWRRMLDFLATHTAEGRPRNPTT